MQQNGFQTSIEIVTNVLRSRLAFDEILWEKNCHMGATQLHTIHIKNCHMRATQLHTIHIKNCHMGATQLHTIHIKNCHM